MKDQKKIEKTLFVVLKTAERCNLNCSYCYFFNGGDESYKKHPPFLRKDVVVDLVRFLNESVDRFKYSTIDIAFHGGEPTLQPIAQFKSMCSYLVNNISKGINLLFRIQTNGTLINEKWVEEFCNYNVSVGVSLDGPKEYNDIFRLDHKGKSSYELTKRGINLLNDGVSLGKINPISALCVIDPTKDAKLIYRYFVDELKFRKMDFLLPDYTHDNFDQNTVGSYFKYLRDLFDEWVSDNNPSIRIRFFESILNMMVGKQSSLTSVGYGIGSYDAITISSNGDISPDDTLRSASAGALMQSANIKSINLGDYFRMCNIEGLSKQINQLPEKCTTCCWRKICRGGFPIHRYSSTNGFNNPSIVCEALKKVYSKCGSFLINHGFSHDQLEKNLGV
jgi:uncharacterized protein